MRRSTLLLILIPLFAPLRVAAAQQVDSGGFVTQLGADTIAVERFVRTKDRIEGVRVARSPATVAIHYVATLGRNGNVTKFEADQHPGGVLDGTPGWTSITEFGRDEIVTTFTGSEGARTIRQPATGVVVPLLFHSYVLYEQVIRQGRRAGRGQIPVGLMYPGQPDLSGTWVRPAGHDTVEVEFFHGIPAIAEVDRDGRLLSFDASATVLKVRSTRVAEIDLPGLIRNFAAADAAGRGLGPISPRDTARITMSGASVMVDYGRPSKRGRTVFGALVPWGKVWRTGADAATQLIVTRGIVLGTFNLRPGRYTLWTVPSQDGVLLVVNGESGQWGTDYHEGRDLARLPMTVRTIDSAVERFTIEFASAATGPELHLRWDTADWSIPIRLQ
jgi:DUF2911 family protein